MSQPGGPIGEDDLQAFVDGRLSRDRFALVERFIHDNPETQARITAYRADRDRLAERLRTDEPIPARLRVSSLLAERRRRRVAWLRGAAAACVVLGLGMAVGWTLRPLAGSPSEAAGAASEDDVTRLAVAAHRLFTAETAHPVEVGAGSQDHLARWISARLGHRLPVPDLGAHGFELVGGRVLPAGEHPAAQIMYENAARQRLTIYIKAGEEGEMALRFADHGGMVSFVWRDDGCGYAVTAALDRETLGRIADGAFRQIEAAADGGS